MPDTGLDSEDLNTRLPSGPKSLEGATWYMSVRMRKATGTLLPGAARQKGLPGKHDPGAAFQQLSRDVDSSAGWGTDGV